MEAHARALEENGFAVVDNALTPDELAALTDAIDAFRRPHRRDACGDGRAHGHSGQPPAGPPRAAGRRLVAATGRTLLVSAGTAVVFDRRLWRARGENTSTRTRKALFFAYTYRWIRARDELALDAALLERHGPIRRQLLGAGTSAIGHWIPTHEGVPLRAAFAAR